MDRAPKKLAMLAPIRCDDGYKAVVEKAASREQRSVADLQRRAVTYYLLQFHGDMVDLHEGEVTDFGALQCDARGRAVE